MKMVDTLRARDMGAPEWIPELVLVYLGLFETCGGRAPSTISLIQIGAWNVLEVQRLTEQCANR